jgi:hypothetical protein
MRYWDDKDGNGNKLTDGRMCLVIKSDTDPDMPEIRTYGKDKEEILDKVAGTAETAQSTIHRLRRQKPAPVATATPARPAAPVVSAEDQKKFRETAAAVGLDVDQQVRERGAQRVANVCEAWEKAHPDYPKDPRNDQILINRAALVAGGNLRITADSLDAAFEQCQRQEMFFEAKPVPPRGSEDSRTVVPDTSYRRSTLRSEAVPSNSNHSTNSKEQVWRSILEGDLNPATGKRFTGRDVEEAIRAENAGNRDYAGFQGFANKLYAKTA